MNSTAHRNRWPRQNTRSSTVWGVFALMSVLLSGCVSIDPKVTVRSWALREASGSYALRDVSRPTVATSPRYDEAAMLLKQALAERGLREVAPGAQPDIFVDLDFGVRRRRQEESSSFPPISLELRRGGNVVEYAQIGTSADGTPQYQSYTTRAPDQYVASEPVGIMRRTSTTLEGRYLRVTARKRFEPVVRAGPPRELWRVEVNTDRPAGNQSSDVRDELPVLIAASLHFLGRTSGGLREVQVNRRDVETLLAKTSGDVASRPVGKK